MEFRNVFNQYQSELQKVEQVLHDSVQSRNPNLTESATQLLDAGGKRIRPLFALICSKLGGGQREHVYSLAAALELIHMATLVHDDVIDDSVLRRGQPTVRARFGDRPAMYTGDFLFARAIQLLSTIDDVRVHREISDAMVRMCEGEIEQIRDFFNWKQTLRNYLRRVERKTALLISVSCSLGALVGGAPADFVYRARKFGYYTGMAFQMTDDVLDYTGEELVVGKPVGGDLRQGNITLPALLAADESANRTELQHLVRVGMDASAVSNAIEIVKSSEALERARALAVRFMKKSTDQLELFGSSPIRRELEIVAHFVNQRIH